MDCKEFKNKVADLFDKEVDLQTKAECERHLSECAACREYYDELKAAARLLQLEENEEVPMRKARHLPLRKVAAMFIGVLMLSGIAYAAIQWMTSPGATGADEEAMTMVADTVVTQGQPMPAENTDDTIYVFENKPLDEIVKEMALYYHLVVDVQNKKAHKLRLYYKWNRKDVIERVVDDLNHFDRVNLAVEGNKLIVKP